MFVKLLLTSISAGQFCSLDQSPTKNMKTTPRTPCPTCGFLSRYSGVLPVGKKAVCNNCKSQFVVSKSIDAPDGERFLIVTGGGNLGDPTDCVGENYHKDALLEFLKKMHCDPLE